MTSFHCFLGCAQALIASFSDGMQWKASLFQLMPLRQQALTALRYAKKQMRCSLRSNQHRRIHLLQQHGCNDPTDKSHLDWGNEWWNPAAKTFGSSMALDFLCPFSRCFCASRSSCLGVSSCPKACLHSCLPGHGVFFPFNVGSFRTKVWARIWHVPQEILEGPPKLFFLTSRTI